MAMPKLNYSLLRLIKIERFGLLKKTKAYIVMLW